MRDAQGHWPTGSFLRSTDPRRCRPGRNSAHSWRCSGCQRLWSCVSGSDPGAHALPAAARPTPRLGGRPVATAGQRAACSRVCAYSAGAVCGARGRGFERMCAPASKGRHPHAPRHAMDLHPLRLRRPRGTRNPPKNGGMIDARSHLSHSVQAQRRHRSGAAAHQSAMQPSAAALTWGVSVCPACAPAPAYRPAGTVELHCECSVVVEDGTSQAECWADGSHALALAGLPPNGGALADVARAHGRVTLRPGHRQQVAPEEWDAQAADAPDARGYGAAPLHGDQLRVAAQVMRAAVHGPDIVVRV